MKTFGLVLPSIGHGPPQCGISPLTRVVVPCCLARTAVREGAAGWSLSLAATILSIRNVRQLLNSWLRMIFLLTFWTVYGAAQASKAIAPKDAGGAFGQRIDATVGGSESWALVVSAYKTTRVSSADWNRYSIVSHTLSLCSPSSTKHGFI